MRRRGEGARETMDCFQSRMEKTMGVMQLWVRKGLEGVTRGGGGEGGEGRVSRNSPAKGIFHLPCRNCYARQRRAS